jgi:hypothetical protein
MRRYFTKEVSIDENEVINSVKQRAYPLQSKAGLQPLFDRIGDARIVMLGEASHGTHEYYTWRSHISKRLIEEPVQQTPNMNKRYLFLSLRPMAR